MQALSCASELVRRLDCICIVPSSSLPGIHVPVQFCTQLPCRYARTYTHGYSHMYTHTHTSRIAYTGAHTPTHERMRYSLWTGLFCTSVVVWERGDAQDTCLDPSRCGEGYAGQKVESVVPLMPMSPVDTVMCALQRYIGRK